MGGYRKVTLFKYTRPALIAVLLASSVARAGDPQLAKDIEALRNSLPLKDGARPTLTLRLADVLFDIGVDQSGNALATDKEKAASNALRAKTVALYEEALKGTQYHPGATGALAYKIEFQLARLYTEQGKVDAANTLWKKLYAQEELKDLRREAALRLAEYYEKQKSQAALKEADKYYLTAIELCGESDVCAYGHYRRAWLLREAGDLQGAISELQVALFDSKGQPREEAVRDLIVFSAGEPGTDGEKGLLLVEKLADKLARPSLYLDLAEAYYSVGNRVAGTRALEHVNQRTPSMAHQVRLLEELYGLRQWDKFRLVLDQVANTPVPETIDPKTEKTLRRLSVQLDGERATRAQYAPEFKSVVLLYLRLFPKDKDRFKMIEGWLASETDPAAKMKKIEEWVGNPALALTDAEEIKLREIRLALAGKAKDSAIVEAESGKLASIVKDPGRVREYKFINALAMKEAGRADEAYAQLQTWAQPDSVQDPWTFRGGLLMVDILVDQKRNTEIAKVAGNWVDSALVNSAAKAAKEKKVWDEGLKHLAAVREEARFEAAVGLGENPEALATFQTYCLAGKFLPKSCDNARVLAVKLKDQKAILAMLKHLNQTSELASEYEAAGFFAESAEIQQKALNAKSSDAEYLKVALLFELGGRFTDRNDLLVEVTKRMKQRKSAGEHEDIIYATLMDAKLLGPEALELPWSESNRLRLANSLELEGKGSARTRKELLASTKAAGVAWSRFVLEELAKQDAAQRKIGFYGRNGQKKFKDRLASITALDNGSVKYFAGADAKTRARIAVLLTKAYTDFSKEILNSPLPGELSPEMLAEVQASLTAMAAPFQAKAADYEKLAREQMASISVVSERAALEALLLPDADLGLIAKVEEAPKTPLVAPSSDEPMKKALAVLHEDPASVTALKEIKAFYESQGKERLASYFQGRILQSGGAN